MIKRPFFTDLIEKAWQKRSLIWLKGVRRSGKTTLAKSMSKIEYFDCEFPRTAKLLEDPEGFFEGLKGKRIVLDEIHRLPDPSRILKTASDHFGDVKVLATGSSTLHASAKFSDTLAGRKTEVYLSPVLEQERAAFNGATLNDRLVKGGMPAYLMQGDPSPSDYNEWLDAYFARDVMELFRLSKRASFLRFTRLLFTRSGGLFDASKFSRECETDRRTLANYLSILEETHLVLVLRPFSNHKSIEITHMPKVCAFDTGFIAQARGWNDPGPQDLGSLFEQLVVQETAGLLQRTDLNHWRDKSEREVDLVISRHGKHPLAVEVKWSEKALDPSGLSAFKDLYPKAELVCVCRDSGRLHKRTYKGLDITVVGLEGWGEWLNSHS